ncbi:hypothetical protein Moror_11615 [Moniliophthora roreri MCA 2997]|uniref:F-box domain-containing protein n=2 Tax=Moniliophthora roreri TaxID=221103 RepID=V2X4Q5_MONRO|nr:hypothetical protein Moror_11615 [Moniliophthora roreri MCA 2997]KAI3616868.1 hypothetical protein WG66_004192 [Moniliophthora roreri]
MASSASGNSDEVYKHLRHLHHKPPAVPSSELAESTSHLDDPSATQNSTSIASLPVELLTAVFDNCVSKGERSDPPVPTLLHVVSVSRQWRAIALSAPRLWARIYLHDPRMMHVAMVQQWLERSHAYPLTLAIRHSTTCEPPVDWTIVEATNEILLMSFRHIHRWRSITFQLTRFITLPELPTILGAAPFLEHVNIDDDGSFDTVSAKLFWQNILAYPSVSRISWIRREMDQTEYLSGLPRMVVSDWGKLTHIQGQFHADDTLLEMLSCCQGLEALNIISLETSQTPVPFRTRFELPCLRSLKLNAKGSLMALVLDSFFALALEWVELKFRGGGLQSAIDFLDRSSWKLSYMKMSGIGISEVDRAFFFALPPLKWVTDLDVTINGIGLTNV